MSATARSGDRAVQARPWIAALALALALAGCPRELSAPRRAGADARPPVPVDAVLLARAASLGEAAPAFTPLTVALDALGPLGARLTAHFQGGTWRTAWLGLDEAAEVWLSVRPDGTRHLFLPLRARDRFWAALGRALAAAGLEEGPLLGEVRAYAERGGAPLLLARAAPGGVLLVPTPVAPLDAAAFLEALARGEGRLAEAPARPAGEAPADVEVFLRPGASLLPLPFAELLLDLSAREGFAALDVDGERLSARLRLALAPEAAARLAPVFSEATAPPAGCALPAGALLAAQLPAGLLATLSEGDGADGRLTGAVAFALYPPPAGTPRDPTDPMSLASALVIGTPRDADAAGALRAALEEERGDVAREVRAGRSVLVRRAPEGAGHRTLRAVVDEDAFVVSLGDAPLGGALERMGRCAPASQPVTLNLDAARLAAAFEGVSPNAEGLPGRVASVLARLASSLAPRVDRLEAGAALADGALLVELTARLAPSRTP